MTPCERLSDRMPAVAQGGQWTADDAAHLAGCPGCSAEWALVRAMPALGADVVAGLDPHRVTERVLTRLRAERAAARDRWRGLAVAGLAAAAAVALTVWAGSPGAPGPATSLDVARADLSLPELDSLRAPELEALLRAMDRGTDDSGTDLVPVHPDELDEAELDGVLEALEG